MSVMDDEVYKFNIHIYIYIYTAAIFAKLVDQTLTQIRINSGLLYYNLYYVISLYRCIIVRGWISMSRETILHFIDSF